MNELKVAIITGFISFLIIFTANIFRNSFSVTFFRSVFTFLSVAGIIYLVQFLFKHFFNLDLINSNSTGSDKSEESNKENINLTIGDDDFSFDRETDKKEEIKNSDTENFQQEEFNTDMEFDTKEEDSIINKKNLDEETMFKNSEQNTEEEIEKNINSDDIFDTAFYDDNKTDNKTIEESDYNNSELAASDDVTNVEKPLKERLGYDATYEELAKAIRSELKRDKE